MNETDLRYPENLNLLSLSKRVSSETPSQPLLFPEMQVRQLEPASSQDEIEQWRIHPDYPVIEVSTFGRFKSVRTGRLINGTLKDHGYVHVGFYFNGKTHTKLAHRLVAKTFLQGSPDQCYVNHKNKVRTDNRMANLEWMTPSQNALHSKRRS